MNRTPGAWRFPLTVAVRYLRARRRRTAVSFTSAVSVSGIALGVAALVIVLALYDGMTGDIQQRILGALAHVTLTPGQGEAIDEAAAAARRVADQAGVRDVEPVVFVQAMVSAAQMAAGVVLAGVDPLAAGGSRPPLAWGRYEDLAGGRNLVLGAEVARRLGAGPGDMVTVVVPRGGLTPLGPAPGIHRFRLVGVFEAGLFDLDNGWSYLDLAQARRLAGLAEGQAQALHVRLRDIHASDRLRDILAAAVGPGVVSTTWQEQNRPLFSALNLEKWYLSVAIALIVLVASLNIVATLVMLVVEKRRDIAVLRAMGATRRQIMQVFMWQGVLIGLVGTSLGVTLGVGAAWACDRFGLIRLDPQVYMIANVPFHTTPGDVLVVAGAALAVSFLATLYPARQAAGLDPMEAIRYE